MLLFFSAFLFSVTGWPAAALTPEEKLADPILEDRARALSKQLRCLVCQNQSIDDSDADLAKDLRREVRGLLQTGASDAAILERIQNSYGDYVLLRPPVSTQTLLLWLAPALILTGGGLIIIFGMRSPRPLQNRSITCSCLQQTANLTAQILCKIGIRIITRLVLTNQTTQLF